MTIEELIKRLEQYPPNMNVKVALHRRIDDLKEITIGVDLKEITIGVDMETNIKSVWLCGDRE